MAKPNRTDDCHSVLRVIDVPKFFQATIESLPDQKKHELYLACEALPPKNSIENIVSAVGPLLVPRVQEWKDAQSKITTSIESAENGLALKFVEEFMSGSQMNWNKFYSLFYPEQAASDDDDMDL